MAGIQAVIGNIIILAIVIFIGFFAMKIKYINNEIKDNIAKIIMKFTLPFLVVTSLTKLEFTGQLAINAGVIMLLAFCTILALYAISCVTSRLFKLQPTNVAVYRCLNSFGNAIFLAYPLIQSVFGDEGLFYAAFYAFVNDTMLWTFGVFMINRAKSKQDGSNEKIQLKKLLNPATISVMIAIVMILFKIKLPDLLQTTFSGIGSMTSYLSMLFIGATLAQINFKNIYKRGSLLFVVFFKLMLIPVLLILLTNLMGIDKVVQGAFVLEVAMPAQTIMTVLLQRYKIDPAYAAEAIFVTTLFSIGTLPFVYYMLQIL